MEEAGSEAYFSHLHHHAYMDLSWWQARVSLRCVRVQASRVGLGGEVDSSLSCKQVVMGPLLS